MPGAPTRGIIRPMRARSRKPVFATLLLLQTLGGGMVALAHAAEPPTAPVAIEREHGARCAVLHDALRCAVCHFPGLRMAGMAAAPAPTGGDVYATPLADEHSILPPRLHGRIASPRAPPAPRS